MSKRTAQAEKVRYGQRTAAAFLRAYTAAAQSRLFRIRFPETKKKTAMTKELSHRSRGLSGNPETPDTWTEITPIIAAPRIQSGQERRCCAAVSVRVSLCAAAGDVSPSVVPLCILFSAGSLVMWFPLFFFR